MSEAISVDSIVIHAQTLESDEPYDIVDSNISFLNDLFESHVRFDEVSADALRSYFVDYFMSQIENGGFSQFVYNTGFEPEVVERVLEGLEAIGAAQHAALLREATASLSELGEERLQAFFASDYFGDNPERDAIAANDEKFAELSEAEDLIALNAAWIRKHPAMVAISAEEMEAEIEKRIQAIPDYDARIAEALENEPRFVKIIRALCDKVGQELEQVTAGDPDQEVGGESRFAWHFLTDEGHFYMVDHDGTATMYQGESETAVAEIPAGDEYGSDED